MSQFKQYFKDFHLWGSIGGLALGYRAIRTYQERNRRVDLFDTGLVTCVGYVIGEILPITVPVIVMAVAFEEYQRQTRPTILAAVREVVQKKD